MQLNLFGFEPTLKIVSSIDRNPIQAYEYFILITPSAKVNTQIKYLKDKLNFKLSTAGSAKSIPHISLLNLKENSNRDFYIIEKTKEALSEIQDFNVLISGVNTIDHTYTKDIILNVDSLEITQIVQSLCKSLKVNTPKKFVPHLIIGKGIPKNKFEKIHTELADFDLRTDFHCRNVTILKRSVEINSKETKKAVYTKIFEAPLNTGIVQKIA